MTFFSPHSIANVSSYLSSLPSSSKDSHSHSTNKQNEPFFPHIDLNDIESQLKMSKNINSWVKLLLSSHCMTFHSNWMNQIEYGKVSTLINILNLNVKMHFVAIANVNKNTHCNIMKLYSIYILHKYCILHKNCQLMLGGSCNVKW